MWGGHPGHMTGDDDDGSVPSIEEQLGAAVDEAMKAEAKRAFIQRITEMDRAEGTGRSEHFRNDETYRDLEGPG